MNSITENLIAEYRNAYTKRVQAYNEFVRKSPTKYILSMVGYEVIEYPRLQYDEADRQPVRNMFGER